MEDYEEVLIKAEAAAYEVIQDIISLGGSMLYQNYISNQSIPFSVNSTQGVVISVLELFFFRYDIGEVKVWEEDIEPSACSIDTWARNAIPVKKKIKMPQSEQTNFTPVPDAKSVASYSSRRSNMNRIGKTSKSRNMKETGAIEETAIPVPIPQPKIDPNDQEEILRAKKEKEIKRKKEEAERLKKIKDEEEEKEKKIVKETEDIKNKSFTYDHKGKIIFVAPVKYESLPNTLNIVRFMSQEPPKEEVKKPVKKTPVREFVSVKRIKTAPNQDQEFVKNITSIQPSLIDSIRLNVGVTLTDGSRTKVPGADAQMDYKTMSRKQYNQLYQPKNIIIENNILSDKRSSSVSSDESLKQQLDSKKDPMDIIPDYEEFKAIDRSEKISSSVSPIRSNQYGKVVYYGNNFELNQSAGPNEKFNAEILKNKNWGFNPPIRDPKIIERVPKRPSTRELRELYGNIIKKPKDKPFITPKELWESKGPMMKKPRDRPNIERVEKKTRMPPPPYGYTMANALPEIPGLGSIGSGKTLN
jgi:Domain of unknown function (DUF4639)